MQPHHTHEVAFQFLSARIVSARTEDVVNEIRHILGLGVAQELRFGCLCLLYVRDFLVDQCFIGFGNLQRLLSREQCVGDGEESRIVFGCSLQVTLLALSGDGEHFFVGLFAELRHHGNHAIGLHLAQQTVEIHVESL